MKKLLLTATAATLGTMGMLASVPEGADLHVLGLNGDNTPSEANLIPMGERDEDDIDEGLWRWYLPSFEITEETGTFTVAIGDLNLGFWAENPYEFSNQLTTKQNMVYLIEGGAAVNYDLPAGDYNIIVSVFEDIYGDMGGDSWAIRIASNNPGGEEEENYYLLGFDENMTPSSGCRFYRQEFEDEGESYVIYSLPKYYLGECPDGFKVYDGAADESYGLDPDSGFSAVSDDVPFAILGVSEEGVSSSLTPGYYTVMFSKMGSMAMISFAYCADQTPIGELEYYLIGANGIMEPEDAVKFTRSVEVIEYPGENGETETYESISYTMSGFDFESAPEGLTVVNAEGDVIFGYNSDLAAFMPNEVSEDSPYSMMSIYGEPLNVTLPSGKYDITFNLAGTTGAAIMFFPAEEGAVDGIAAGDAPAVYYNLQGLRVSNPDKGVYIVRQGEKSYKVRK